MQAVKIVKAPRLTIRNRWAMDMRAWQLLPYLPAGQPGTSTYLIVEYPETKFINSMHAGKSDCLDHRPDVLSILIGVNDIWHGLTGSYDGTVQRYENDYMALIERTRMALPNVQLVICEPFVLKCGAVDEKWFPEFDHYRAVARRVASQNSATFVPFQEMFDRALSFAPAQHWARDGVHPSHHGSALIGRFLAASGSRITVSIKPSIFSI